MNGKQHIRFSELFKDSASIMNYDELFMAYVIKGKMAEWEFAFWYTYHRK